MNQMCQISTISRFFHRRRSKILGENESVGYWHKHEMKLLKILAPPFMAAVVTLSPICNLPVSVAQSIDVQRAATLFRRACIGCQDAEGNIIQPGATHFLKDLQRSNMNNMRKEYLSQHGSNPTSKSLFDKKKWLKIAGGLYKGRMRSYGEEAIKKTYEAMLAKFSTFEGASSQSK